MALDERQIVRFSRQILLREVGGRGQEALQAAPVRVEATGGAGLVAAAYLAAGGTPAQVTAVALAPDAPGFLLGAGEGPAAIGPALAALDPAPAHPEARPRGQLAEAPAAFGAEPPWVVLGSRDGEGVLLWRGLDGCAACFLGEAARLAAPPRGAPGVLLGALGALALQRLRLGAAEPLGLRRVGPHGDALALPVPPCPACAR